MNPNKPRYTLDQIEDVLVKNHGNISKTARDLGYNPRYLWGRLKKEPELMARVNAARESLLDDIEDVLYDKATDGDLSAIRLVLEARGKRRGYGSKSIEMYGEVNHQHRLSDDMIDTLIESLQAKVIMIEDQPIDIEEPEE